MQASRQGDGHQGVRGSSCANAAPRSWFGEVNVVALPRAPGAEGDCEMGLHDAEGPGVHRDAAKREARSGASATGSEASMPSMLSGMDVVPPPRGAAGASRPDGIEGNAPAAEFRAGVLPWRSMNARHSAHSRALDQAVAAGGRTPMPCRFPAQDSLCGRTMSWCSAGHGPHEDADVWEQLRNRLLLDAKLHVSGNCEAVVFNPRSLSFSLTEQQEPKLNAWFPERGVFWREEGKRIAWRNLWVSMFNLMLGFGVWLMWSALAVQIQVVHDTAPDKFTFGLHREVQDMANSTRIGAQDVHESASARRKYHAMLYLLPSLAGLAGGAFRIINSFVILPIGGRMTSMLTSLMLIVPCSLASWELSLPQPRFLVLAVAAMLSGLGGGAFAASMSNITNYFPTRTQGISLGLNGGIGNLGVSLAQIFIPLAVGSFCSDALANCIPHAGDVWLGAFLWIPPCIIGAIATYMWANDMPHHGNAPTARRVYNYLCLQAAACAAAAVAGIMLFTTEEYFSEAGATGGQVILMVVVVCVIAHVFLWFGTSPEIQKQIRSQMAIFRNPHTYVVTWMYVTCFGTYIGFSSVFPKLIQDVFGYVGDGDRLVANPHAPRAILYSFLGPFVGSAVRPFGGWLSDKFGGALVTQIYVGILAGSAVGVGLVVQRARESQQPEEYFHAFLSLFLIMFTASGIANGSTFKLISQLYREQGHAELVGPVLGWSSAIASFGAFVVPSLLGEAVTAKDMPDKMFGFAGYYLICFMLNFWFYLRRQGCCKMQPCLPLHSGAGICASCGGVRVESGQERNGGPHQRSATSPPAGTDYCICHILGITGCDNRSVQPRVEHDVMTGHAHGAATPLSAGTKAQIQGWLSASRRPPPSAADASSVASADTLGRKFPDLELKDLDAATVSSLAGLSCREGSQQDDDSDGTKYNLVFLLCGDDDPSPHTATIDARGSSA